MEPDVYFWRDSAGHEVDFILDHGETLAAIEAKSGETIASDSLKSLAFWRSLPGQNDAPIALLHGGTKSTKRGGAVVYSWRYWL